jgi:arsenate reductase (glutaredoxin)
VKLSGIPNCDTVKKARVFLEKRKITFEFRDFKKEPPTKDEVLHWKKAYGDWPVNTKGPTFRKNKEAFEAATDAGKIKLMVENSSMIKRPILENKGKVIAFGFDEESYKKNL